MVLTKSPKCTLVPSQADFNQSSLVKSAQELDLGRSDLETNRTSDSSSSLGHFAIKLDANLSLRVFLLRLAVAHSANEV